MGGQEWDSGTIIFNALEPAQIPTFAHFDEIQRIRPNGPFTFEWTAWENSSGYIPFDVIGPDGHVIGGAVPGGETSFTVPAGTFTEGTLYRAVVNFSSGYFQADTEWGGNENGHQFWNYRTEIQFTPIPEPASAAGLAIALLVLCLVGLIVRKRRMLSRPLRPSLTRSDAPVRSCLFPLVIASTACCPEQTAARRMQPRGRCVGGSSPMATLMPARLGTRLCVGITAAWPNPPSSRR